jgi:L-amino acid N-acyltransferase YncA
MRKYVIKDYQKGYEPDQVRIGVQVARNWIWPYAYDLEGLLKVHAQPDFDPDTRHYCFLGDEMVGYMFSVVAPPGDDDVTSATLDFPRMMPGHEGAAELLMERAFETLRKRGVSRVVGRVTTMCPGDIRFAETAGFSIRDWGYKVYYSYEMAWGALSIPVDSAQEVDREADLDECAQLAARWYKRPPEWCRSLLEEWHEAGVITHVGVREGGTLIAACMAAPNEVRPSTAAIYYIYTPDERSLTPMLAKVVNACVDYGVHNLIADLIYEHRQYEPVYQALGFKKVADWARCERVL